jgi:hypothetical protein
MENVMKNTFNQLLLTLLVTGVAPGLLAAAPAAPTNIGWQFATKDTVIPPDAGSSSVGLSATITPGQFSSGWLAEHPVFGGASGLWDLGRRGTITMGNLGAALGNPATVRTFTVRVQQWVDGAIYTVPATVAVPGAVLVAHGENALAPTGVGAVGATGWVIEETEWRADAGSAVNSMTITSAYDGSVVDSVAIAVSGEIPADLVLTIEPATDVAGAIRLSWPDAAGSATLESSTNQFDPQSWTPLTVVVSQAGGRYTTTVPASDGIRYFRLKR